MSYWLSNTPPKDGESEVARQLEDEAEFLMCKQRLLPIKSAEYKELSTRIAALNWQILRAKGIR